MNHNIKPINKSTIKYKSIFAFLVICVFAVPLFRSAFFSISTPDESFYLTIPYRLIQGDALIVDEWHASQFSALLLYLPMKIFLLVTNSTDGIVLYFRLLFVLCQTIISIFTFTKLKKYGNIPALISAILYLLYVPETVNMLDYYTMSLMGFQVVSLILFCSKKLTSAHLFFVGIVFACIVLAQPFNSIIYFIFSIAVLVLNIKNHKKLTSEYLSTKTWLLITAGITVIALPTVIFLFSKMSLSEFVNNIGNVFGGNDHILPFSSEGETDMFAYYVIFETLINNTPISFCLSLLHTALLIIDRNRLNRRTIWLLSASFVILIMVIENIFILQNNLIPILFKPYILFILSLSCYMLTEQKDRKLFFIFVSGLVYVVFLGLVSQALDYIGVIGLVISNTALAPILKQLISEYKEQIQNPTLLIKKSAFSCICIISSVAILFDIVSGTAIKFMDDPAAIGFGRPSTTANYIIDQGPLKGIHTSEETAKSYYEILSDLHKINSSSNKRVLVAGLIPWTYFCFDKAPATFTTWYINAELDLYDKYYKDVTHIPEYIYIPKTSFYYSYDHTSDADYYKDFFSQMFSVSYTESNAGYIMLVENIA